jgi:hypothetical protein
MAGCETGPPRTSPLAQHGRGPNASPDFAASAIAPESDPMSESHESSRSEHARYLRLFITNGGGW